MLLAPLAVPFANPTPAQARASALADPALEDVWTRTDLPVERRAVVRSWTWGPDTFYTNYEPYAQGPGGQHLVTYFDKSRMEINNPSANRNSPWFVTNGLLVVDMIAGQIQAGDQQFMPATPANIAVAGDIPGNADTPTYASLAKVASLNGDHRSPNRTGQNIRDGLGRNANIGAVDNLAGFAKYGRFEPTTGHNIADVFWTFLNQKGIVYQDGRYVTDTLVDWLFAMGYPLTEPYWIKIRVGSEDRWVLMQAFQRRILTYSPFNPEGWKVEMGNVGRAYYDWRYAGQPPAPTPTPRPITVASISINPAVGDTTTQITVSGKDFPANTGVSIRAEQPGDNYFRNLGAVTAGSDGRFTTKVALPADASRLDNVSIVAIANGGAIRAAQTFRLSYDPSVVASPNEIVSGGTLRVQGDGFPANVSINVGVQFTGAGVEWLGRARANGNGSFETSISIGNRPVGGSFKVIALADSGQKATTSSTQKVLAQPSVSVSPNSGPAGANVTFRGANWPANRAISIGLRGANTQATTWLPNSITTDGAGNFAITMFIGPEYANAGQARLIAFEPVSTLRQEAGYTIVTNTRATLFANPSTITVGQVTTVTGGNFDPLAVVSVGVGRIGSGVEEWLGQARVDANGNFRIDITLGARWQNAGVLRLTASTTNKVAMTDINVVGVVGRIIPAGMPMTVNVHSDRNTTQLYKLNAQGWLPGRQVNINIVSADGSVNQQVASATVNAYGIFSASFYAVGAWVGRSDLGVKATTTDGAQFSLRYLPLVSMVKVNGNGNNYTVTGFNMPANTQVDVVLHDDEQDKADGIIDRTVSTDGNGAFTFTINLPRLPDNTKIGMELRARNQPYSATFSY
jgi:hypothetical protein